MIEKVIWVVEYDDLSRFLDQARAAGATGVAIRTNNDMISAIRLGQQRNLKVYGWRWPSIRRDAAMHEAAKAAQLLQQGLDGYFVDPEGTNGSNRDYCDWDRDGLAQLADDFCKMITSAAAGKAFGVTSHYRAARVFPHLPWKAFFRYATVLLPQAYWRCDQGHIGGGVPAHNYAEAISAWSYSGGDKSKIVSMAGELAYSSANEIEQYATAAAGAGVTSLHFYADTGSVRADVWKAIAKI